MQKHLPLYIFVAALLLLPRSGLAGERSADLGPGKLLAEGTYAPDFTLNDINGNLIDIAGSLGNTPIILAFWSIYCDSCVEELLALQKLETRFHDSGLLVLAVNEDLNVPAGRVSRFLERLEKYREKITYPVLVDPGSETMAGFGISSLPTLVVIDRAGRIASYFHGFDPESEIDILETVEKTAISVDSGEKLPTNLNPLNDLFTVTGEASLCGFFESDTWRKGFTGSNDLQQEVALTRDVAQRDASRKSVSMALDSLGITLFSRPPRLDCLDGSGIHLARDPLSTSDPLSNLIERIDYGDYFETVTEHDALIDGTYYSTKTVRLLTDRFSAELESLGYSFTPLRIDFAYVNMDPLDMRIFLGSLLKQSMFIGQVSDPAFSSRSTSQTFEVYTSSHDFADEISGMDFGVLNVFIEEITDTSLEVEVWK